MLDRQVRQVLLPRIEALCSDPQDPGSMRRAVQAEFQECLSQDILPELEKAMKLMVSQVQQSLSRVDDVLYKKLVHEEARSDQMVALLEQKLNHLYQPRQPFQQPILVNQYPQPVQQPYQLVQQPSLSSQQKSLQQMDRAASLQIQQQPFAPSQSFMLSNFQPQYQPQVQYPQQYQQQYYQQEPIFQPQYKMETPEFTPQYINVAPLNQSMQTVSQRLHQSPVNMSSLSQPAMKPPSERSDLE